MCKPTWPHSPMLWTGPPLKGGGGGGAVPFGFTITKNPLFSPEQINQRVDWKEAPGE